MAPTGRYPPGQLVWVKVRADRDEFDYDGSYTPRMDVANFKVGLVIRDVTTAEADLYGLYKPAMIVLIEERIIPVIDSALYSIDTFPLEDEE